MNFFDYEMKRVKPLMFRFSNGGGNPNGSEGSNGAGDGTETGEGANQNKLSFDDILKNKDYQAEFDRRITKALEKGKAKWELETNEKITEAEKVASMNAEEKAKHDLDKRENALTKREADVARRELTYTAKGILSEKGLPTELSDMLDYSSAENCTKSIETLGKVFKAAVEKSVDERIKENARNPKGGGGQAMSGVEAAFYGLNPNLKK